MKRRSGVVILIILCHIAASGRNISPVQNGLLDLRNHNWKKEGIVKVSGNWDFYWNTFYSPDFFKDSMQPANHSYAFVPDFWNKYIPRDSTLREGFGYATYHVKILCPSSPQPLALKFLTIQGAYRLFVNGKQMLTVGDAETSEQKTITKLKPTIINVRPENNILDVVMQVSNFNNRVGGLWDIVEIGTANQIATKTVKNLSVAFIVAGIFFLAFVYNIIQFFHFKRRYAFLFFALLCFAIFTRILVIDEIPIEYLININWELVRRFEYISFYCSVPVMSLFSYYLFRKDFSRIALYFIIPVTSVFILISIFGSYYTYTSVVHYYQMIMMVAALYGLYVYIRAVVKRRRGSNLFLLAFIIFLATIVNDLLYVNLVVDTVPLFYAGISCFAIILFIMLSRQFAQTFSDLQLANYRLADANEKLGLMNDDIQQKNAELKKINHELDVFVHRTSHDLTAPLSSVTGIAYLIEGEKDISAIHDYAALQKKTLQRMDELIKDIIDVSKNKRLELTPEKIDFQKIVDEALEDHSHLKNAEAIYTNVEIQQDEDFLSDKRRISTIINNLISNAIKYADLSKPKPCIGINIIVENSKAHIQVNDNGIGIDKSQLEKIFTMFYRATSSSSGSGLGLYIIKETVDKLNGTITVNSEKDQGTTIDVIIPP